MASSATTVVAQQSHQLLLLREVLTKTRLSSTTIWRLEKTGKFPKRLKIGVKRVAWRSSDIDAWLATKVAEVS